jgi:hypothetical protein
MTLRPPLLRGHTLLSIGEAVHAWHLHVGQDDLGRLSDEQGQCLGSVSHQHDASARFPQRAVQQFARIGFVILSSSDYCASNPISLVVIVSGRNDPRPIFTRWRRAA